MKFRARWFDPQKGKVQETVQEAVSVQAAALQLQNQGVIVLALELAESKVHRLVGTMAFFERLRGAHFDAAWWCTEVRVLLGAGMTVVEAIDTVLAQSASAQTREVNQSLAHHLQQGLSLSVAMSRQQVFPAVLLAGVLAGERSGALIEALDEYLRFHAVIDKMRRQFVSAAIYPAMVLFIGFLIGLFLLLFVMPRFAAIYADLPQGADSGKGLTSWVLAVSEFLATQTKWIVASMALVMIALLLMWRSGWFGRAWAAFSEWTPAVRVRVDEFRLAKFFQAMALMYRGGYTLDEAMQRSAQMGLGARMSGAIDSARVRVVAGVSPAEALASANLLDDVALRLMRVGERVGHFDRVLSTIAERHAQRFGTIVERVTRVAEPLMLLIVALAVGTLVLLMYIPIFDIAGSVR